MENLFPVRSDLVADLSGELSRAQQTANDRKGRTVQPELAANKIDIKSPNWFKP